ncbi:MAG: hypothetical protein U1E77_10010 [Inhella sp.]
MNDTTHCPCSACPGTGCTCGCQTPAAKTAAPSQCACGPACRCGSACACPKA